MIDGEPWWVAKDVCDVLEIANSRDTLTRLDADEKDDVGLTDAIGRLQNTAIVNESGLYELIFGSRKPEAKEFKRWIKREVIPAISWICKLFSNPGFGDVRCVEIDGVPYAVGIDTARALGYAIPHKNCKGVLAWKNILAHVQLNASPVIPISTYLTLSFALQITPVIVDN